MKQEPFVQPWYTFDRKFLKQKLGSLYHCTVKDSRAKVLCRVMEYDRISSYQIEAFFTELARIQLYKLSNYVVMPIGIHVSPKMEISVVLPQLVSLHELLHGHQDRFSGGSIADGLTLSMKMDILIELAKVLNQFHNLASPIAHGSINSHNVFF